MTQSNAWLDTVKFNDNGLVPAIAQDVDSGKILMVAWMNREALLQTQLTQQAVYFSRSRSKLWHKGETSGHFQYVHEIRLDCDYDVIILTVTQHGGIACHTGRESCFFYKLIDGNWQPVEPVLKDPEEIYQDNDAKTKQPDQAKAQSTTLTQQTDHHKETLSALYKILQNRKHADAGSSYVASLYTNGLNKILEKVGEECVEAIIAAKDADQHPSEHNNHALIHEVADLWFHTMVTLSMFNIAPAHILNELANRFGVSGHAEKASRQTS